MDMPPAPAPGQAADALDVQRAVAAGIKRAFHFGSQTEESKRQRGEDGIRVIDIAVTAAQHYPQNVLQQILRQQQVQAAQLDNMRRRGFNDRAYDSRKDDARLRSLRKELMSFQLDDLAAFYEEEFQGATVAERRAAFREFILT